MKIAVPLTAGKVSSHFGHCEEFGFYVVEDGEVKEREVLSPPPHEPGSFPRWLKERGAQIIISSGMGHRARDLFSQQGIDVVAGAPEDDPEEIVRSYLEGRLATGENPCDH